MKEVLAEITLDSKSRKTRDISLLQKHVRFKCTRCATFCCRLGGPKLTKKDVERIKKTGYSENFFLEPTNSVRTANRLKSKENGSCVFLKSDLEHKQYECSIYNFRPILCRLYPFNFNMIDSNTIALKLIPCCRGLNNLDGEPVNERFISNHLLTTLLKAIESS